MRYGTLAHVSDWLQAAISVFKILAKPLHMETAYELIIALSIGIITDRLRRAI